jgi:hypothetical protein
MGILDVPFWVIFSGHAQRTGGVHFGPEVVASRGGWFAHNSACCSGDRPLYPDRQDD